MKLICWLIIGIILVGCVSALGVVPASKKVLYDQGRTETIDLQIMNNEHKTFSAVIYVEGELAQYVTAEQSIIEVKSNEDSKQIKLTMQMPPNISKQGNIESNIVIREVGTKDQKSTVASQLAVTTKLTLTVPYSGKYAEINLLTPNFEKGKESNFAVEVINYGDQDIEEAQAFVDIIGPLNNKITTLVGESKRVNAKAKEMLIVKWTPELNNGPYRAVATVVYDGKSANEEKAFEIGEPTLTIDSISVKDFTLGGIAKFDILVGSNWGMAITDVYGNVKIADASTTYTSYKTASLSVEPNSKQLFQAYWDTQKVIAGNYKLEVELHYLDKTSSNSYDITVNPNEIRLPEIGAMAATTTQTDTKMSITVLALIIFGVFALTVVNSYFLWKRFRKKQ